MQHRSFWLSETLGDAPDEPPLQGAARADVAIVGGGLVGLWTAIRIKERDPACDVGLLEQDICGGGASGRNGGEVLSWWAKAGKLVDLCGREEGVRIARASVDAIGELEEFCTAHGIDADYHRGGYLWTATTPAQLGAWDSTVELLRDLGAPALELLEPEEVARRTGSDVHLAGVLDPSAATVQPAKLTRGLRRVALELGVRIHEHSRVTNLDRRSPAVLRTTAGAVTADRVVLATNAWAASLRELHRRLVVISSDMITTARIPERLQEIGWTGGECISDSQLQVHYYHATREGRVAIGKGGWGIAIGGRIPQSFDRNQGRAEEVARGLRRLYPMLADVPVEYDWSGPIDRSATGIPIFGHLGGRPDIVFGVGFSGNGVAPSVLGGQILASLALDADDEWTRCGLVDGRQGTFPPDPIRYVGAHLVRTAVARKERAEEVGAQPSRLAVALAGLAPSGIIPKKGAEE
jgi:putative aminophosphonate oxidoreductase